MKPLSVAALILLSSAALAQPPPIPGEDQSTWPATDRLKAFQAAGFKLEGRRLVGCDTEPQWPKSRLQYSEVDLDGDGAPEVLIEEGNVACYGDAGQAFHVLTRDAKTGWRQIANEVGMPNVLKTRHKGWLDIEVGGPGMGVMPVRRWNGRQYE